MLKIHKLPQNYNIILCVLDHPGEDDHWPRKSDLVPTSDTGIEEEIIPLVQPTKQRYAAYYASDKFNESDI